MTIGISQTTTRFAAPAANVASPAFACVAGIYAAVASGLVVQQVGRGREALAANGYLGRVGQWLKDGF